MIDRFHITSWIRRRRAVRRRFNPYIAGTPVFDRQLFFGRETLARRALRIIESRSLAVIGERRIGKTSFLHHLGSALATDSSGERRYFPVFVDLEGVTARSLLHALMEEALESLAVPQATRDALRYAGWPSEYPAADFDHDVRRLAEGLGRQTQLPATLVFLIDEVDALRGGMARLLHGASFAPLLADGSQPLRAVLAGVGRDGVLEELELEPFTPLAAEALVREPVAGVYRYEPRAIELVLEASRLRPFAIQRICRNAVDRMLDDGRTTIRASDVGASGAEARRDVQCR